jgi:hypothetical protein
MFRYNFVPMHASDGLLEIALAERRNLNRSTSWPFC